MFAVKKSIQTILLASAIASIGGSKANAQCLLDIFGLGKSSTTQATSPYSVPAYPYAASYPVVPAGYTLQGQPNSGAMPYSAGYAGVPQSAISLAAPTSYNTSYFSVPTTYYRPVTTTDPRTGQQVTTMMPCTSYQMQALRSPAWSLGQWVHGGNQTPMVPAAALPSAASSPGLMPQGANNSNFSGMTANSADPNVQPILPTINPSLPVYGNPIQSSYGNPSIPLNSQPMMGGYNNGVVSANYLPAATPNGFAPGSTVPNYSSSFGINSGVYPGDGSAPATSNIPASNGGGVYPSIATDPQYQSAPMYSADPPQTEKPSTSDPGATEKPILPPTDSTSRSDRHPNPSLLSSNENQGRIQSVVRQPPSDIREMSSKGNSSKNKPDQSDSKQAGSPLLSAEPEPTGEGTNVPGPALKPIPLPDGFDTESKWNPSLLNSNDKTAALQSHEKPNRVEPTSLTDREDVRWASFSEPSLNQVPRSADSVERGRRAAASYTPKSEPKSRYDTDGWKSAK